MNLFYLKDLSCGLVLLASGACLLGVIGAKAEEQQAAQTTNLVVYYSYTGNTELVGKTLAGALKADVIVIEDVTRPTREQAYGAGKEASLQGKA